MAASPLLFMAFFLATSPKSGRSRDLARPVFAVTTGMLAAALQLYVSVAWGPYLALLLVGLLTPIADRMVQPRPLASPVGLKQPGPANTLSGLSRGLDPRIFRSRMNVVCPNACPINASPSSGPPAPSGATRWT